MLVTASNPLEPLLATPQGCLGAWNHLKIGLLPIVRLETPVIPREADVLSLCRWRVWNCRRPTKVKEIESLDNLQESPPQGGVLDAHLICP